jgi:hypothetical protein
MMDLERASAAQTEIAWAAGFLDGEGCIRVVNHDAKRRRTSSHLLHVHVVQVSREPLDALRALFGGGIYRSHRTNPGRNCRPAWTWSVYGQVAASAVKQMLPYLIVKRPQAELAVSIDWVVQYRGNQNRRAMPDSERRRRADVCAQIKLLNRTGLHAPVQLIQAEPEPQLRLIG